jgi:Carboxypeptidase regulatory-like domain/TonB-dependent Receptor Plug Domain
MWSPSRGVCWRTMVAATALFTATADAQDTARGATQAAAPSRVIGKVTDTTGVRLSKAEISILNSEMRTVADDSGEFTLADVPSGVVVFSVRRLGYEAATFTAVLKPGKAHRVTFPLTELAANLPGMTVAEKHQPSGWLADFEKHRSGGRGMFITRTDIERRQARTASDVMRMVPGVQIVATRLGPQLVMTRGAGVRRCLPQLYVHTTPYSGMIDDFSADDIEAIEVYAGISELPADLNTMGRPVCAAVVIWTREPPKKEKPKG